jgi:hypothetical protein
MGISKNTEGYMVVAGFNAQILLMLQVLNRLIMG